jgi:hypothetical protein
VWIIATSFQQPREVVVAKSSVRALAHYLSTLDPDLIKSKLVSVYNCFLSESKTASTAKETMHITKEKLVLLHLR